MRRTSLANVIQIIGKKKSKGFIWLRREKPV